MARILTRYICIPFISKPLSTRHVSCTRYNASRDVVGRNHGEESFEEMFRQSQFAKLVRPVDKVVAGRISHVVNDELYIDMGWKFHVVVKVASSKINSQTYQVGDTVKVKINELEMTGHFLGQFKRITLCEADVSLVEDAT